VGRLGLWIVLTLVVSAASNVTEVNGSAEGNGTLQSLTVERNGSADDRTTARMAALRAELETLEQESGSEDIWSKIYSNYITYQNLQHRLDVLSKRYFKLNRLEKPTPREREELRRIKMERATLRSKLDLLKEYADNPFRKLLAPPKLDEPPEVGSPVGIIGAISYRQKLANDRKAYAQTHQSLVQVLDHLRAKQSIMGRMLDLDPYNTRLQNELTEVNRQIETLLPVEEILKTTEEVYSKKIEEARLKVDADIAREIRKAAVIAGVVLGFFILFLLAKYLIQRYMSKKESFYLINKALNFIFLNVVVLILLFAYIENVSYLVTILGFASAGIAIAMKDWFMSLLGWFVIVIGGSVHVGDRVKFVRNGMEYVGDIVDISPLRMTMQEDITLTTYMHNRRSGRMIFIPNNYIFTDMLANYSHAGLKTVWDGIDFMITYDSNAQKAIAIAKEVVKKYSKGYTEITRKQLNKLRKSYHLKNTNVEPRVYSFIEPYGIKISAWYMTNAYATLTLRSTISLEILERLRAEEDITLAYPTQALYLNEHIPAPTPVPPGEPPAGEPAPSV
jgi:small-conductance mechanosensitive channel